MTEAQLWELYAQYRMNQHNARAVSLKLEKYWGGRADSLLVVAKSLGYQTNLEVA
jgi:hypothetical protein